MKSTRHIILKLFLLAALIAVMYAFYRMGKKPVELPLPSITTVTVTPLIEHPLAKIITAYATVIAPNAVDFASQTSGTITSIDFKPGDLVKKGQVLFTIASNSIDDQTQKLLAAMQLAQNTYQRALDASKADPESISQSDLMQDQLLYEQALSMYQAANRVEKAVSPIDGTVADTNLSVGSFVNAGTILVHIDAPDIRQLTYQLPSQYQSEIAIGQTVTFTPNDSKNSYLGKVSYIAPQLNTTDFSITLRADFDNPNTLPANLFGTITQTLEANAQALAIPMVYVQSDAEGFYVYSLDKNKVEKLHFIPGAINASGLIEVQSGIAKNTPVITSQLTSIIEGQTVAISS